MRPAPLTVTCELVPPRDADAAAVSADARRLGELADALNVTDGPRASVRMSALAATAIVRAEGVDAILQMTTRDRNRIALAADAIGAVALGARGVLALWGDPVSVGEQPEAAEVRDLETLELIELLARTRDGRPLLIGAAAAASPAPLGGLAAKVGAGADLVQTQIVLDADAFAEWFGRVRDAGMLDRARVLAGIAVPASPAALAAMERMGAHASEEMTAAVARGAAAQAVADMIDRLAGLDGLGGIHLMPLGAPPGVVADLAAHARRAFSRR
jgi:methylenetetrahydrofolate reductase (NADPH)